ncbi:hypothetical protein [Hoylesella oralis]|uniref:hypothetical protein n=1 Tax=Hoylesella oralis TaxID=28134 RepID=UPI0028EF1A54|nr:hypothetical protein [Hoylesella oralis]
MKKYLAFAMLLLVSCNFTNEDKARSLIKESMKKTLLIADSYEAVETKLDSAFTPYDSSEFFENVVALAQCGMETDKAQKDANRAKSSMAIWSGSYMDAFSRNQYREYKYKYEKSYSRRRDCHREYAEDCRQDKENVAGALNIHRLQGSAYI